MMKDSILDFIRRKGVHVVLTQKVIKSTLDTYYYNWVGQDGRYFSLLVASNDTSFFVKSGNTFSLSSYDSVTSLESALRCFDSKDEWSAGKWTLEEALNFCSFIQRSLDSSNKRSVEVGAYRLVDERFWLRPALGISVFYSVGDSINVLTFWHGCKTLVSTNDKDFLDFVKALGYTDLVEVSDKIGGISNEVVPVEVCNSF